MSSHPADLAVMPTLPTARRRELQVGWSTWKAGPQGPVLPGGCCQSADVVGRFAATRRLRASTRVPTAHLNRTSPKQRGRTPPQASEGTPTAMPDRSVRDKHQVGTAATRLAKSARTYVPKGVSAARECGWDVAPKGPGWRLRFQFAKTARDITGARESTVRPQGQLQQAPTIVPSGPSG